MSLRAGGALLLVLSLGACGGGGGGHDAGPPPADAGADASFDIGPAPACGDIPSPPDASCAILDTDYTPGADDAWPACVSDDGAYHPIMEPIGSVARVAAFEQLAASLFDPTRDPGSDEFLSGRLLYQEDEGLDSRLVRRYDPHFEVPDGTDCTQAGVPDTYPDYCVGPGRLQPLVLDAFAAGIDGTGAEPTRMQAARIEAAILWFLAVSPYKESLTCTGTPEDCDSAYAYYTGGEAARGGLGLARYVNEVDADAHDRAWDGVLAVRCWRDLDAEVPATDLVQRDLARAQLDRAIVDGVAAIVRDRLARLCDVSGAELAYHWAFVRTLAPFLDRSMVAASPSEAAAFATALDHDRPGDVDVAAAVAALDAAYTCP